jgi:hypothetical protein
MFSDDQNYLSLMTSVALAVLMAVVMFWIRAQIPDEQSPADVAGTNGVPVEMTASDGAPLGDSAIIGAVQLSQVESTLAPLRR